MTNANERTNSPMPYLAADDELLEIRADAAFTASYVNSDSVNVAHAKSILLLIDLDGDTISDSQLKIQFGNSITIADIVHAEVVTDNTLPQGVPTLAVTEFEMGGTDLVFCLVFPNPGATVFRCSVKANTTSGSCRIRIMRGQSTGIWPFNAVGSLGS